MGMNPVVKAKWVAALRSGEYKQAKDALRSGDGFCCLGVLCDIHAKETGTSWNGDDYMGVGGTPPLEVKDWAGLSSYNPRVKINDEEHEVAVFNDGSEESGPPRTFSEIADAIESQL